jgi:hypothetical protein
VRLVVTLTAACLAGVASCSLLTSVDGLAGVDPTDAGPDALVATEGGSEGGSSDGGDGGATSFCATQGDARLCEDFDEAPLPGAFDGRSAAGATAMLDSTLSASPRSSLSVIMGAATDGTDRYGGVDKRFILGSSTVTLNAKVHLVKVPTVIADGPRADFLTIACGNTPGAALFSLIVQMRPTASGAAEAWLTSFTEATGSVVYLTPFAAMPVGRWQELRVTTNWTTKAITLEGVDPSGSVELGFASFVPPSNLTLPPPACELGVGIFSNFPHDGWSVRYDDVVLRTP